MRPIKFRVWIKKKQEMLPVTGLDLREAGVYSIGVPYAKEHNWYDTKVPPDIELMQYTCLKDKHGKEIYEGDILQDGHTNACRGAVWWRGFCWDCGTEEDIRNDQTPIITETDAIEIIGNIYEDPTLLRGKT